MCVKTRYGYGLHGNIVGRRREIKRRCEHHNVIYSSGLQINGGGAEEFVLFCIPAFTIVSAVRYVFVIYSVV